VTSKPKVLGTSTTVSAEDLSAPASDLVTVCV